MDCWIFQHTQEDDFVGSSYYRLGSVDGPPGQAPHLAFLQMLMIGAYRGRRLPE
jgi:hypothetical protein